MLDQKCRSVVLESITSRIQIVIVIVVGEYLELQGDRFTWRSISTKLYFRGDVFEISY